jgi:ABC-2 type transport system ATP-binding protein
MTAPLAECVGVSKVFGTFTAVRDVRLQVRPGEIVGLLGANGAGKTTVIRILLGLLRPSAGRVALFGQAPSRHTRARLGYVPQGLGLYDDLTPAENLQFAAQVFGSEPGVLGSDLRGYAGELTSSLPLGVQRRVAFAEALAHHPELLILDEPTSGVDPLARARLWETIAEAAQSGAGVLVTTHYMEEAGECGRLIIMADGVVVADGTAAEIIGGARVTVVRAGSWSAAFRALTDAGLQVALAGRALRVPGAGPAQVRQALGDLPAEVGEAPATLEERFFELASSPRRQAGAA